MLDSWVTTVVVAWVSPAIEGAGIQTIYADNANPILIKSNGQNLIIENTEIGESIAIYSLDGILLHLVKVTDATTILPLNEISNSIYIIKYRNQSIKYRF